MVFIPQNLTPSEPFKNIELEDLVNEMDEIDQLVQASPTRPIITTSSTIGLVTQMTLVQFPVSEFLSYFFNLIIYYKYG